MARKTRKTITVESVKDRINAQILQSQSPHERTILARLLSSILMDVGQYHGFNYVAWLDGGYHKWVADGEPKDNTPYLGDQTIVRFY